MLFFGAPVNTIVECSKLQKVGNTTRKQVEKYYMQVRAAERQPTKQDVVYSMSFPCISPIQNHAIWIQSVYSTARVKQKERKQDYLGTSLRNL